MLRTKIEQEVAKALSALHIEEPVELNHPANDQFGDYSTSIALKLGKKLGKNPVEVAQQIAGAIKSDLIEKVEVVKPGFVNIWVNKEVVQKEVSSIGEKKTSYGSSDMMKGKKVMIEYTDPNPFKEFHIGHLYSNIVGESLARLHETTGAEVKRVNYQGDVGMHVAKSVWGMQQLLKERKTSLEKLAEKPLEERAKFMGEAYAFGASQFEDENKKKEIVELNKKIYAKDESVIELYTTGRQWSLDYFETIYKRLGTTFTHYFFEREVGERGVELVKEYLQKGVFEKSEGAVVFKGEHHGLHTRVFLNSHGLPTYEAKDLALPTIKYEIYPYDLSIIVTGNEINEYFKVVLKAMEQVSPDLRAKTKHISHGMVRLPEGKMSSRKGNVITGESLLDIAKSKAEEIMAKSQKTKATDPETSEIIGVGAIKYALLKNNIGKNVEFDFDESINFDGNSGPYLQYTYVRCKSVLHNAKTKISLLQHAPDWNGEETNLMRKLVIFPDIVSDACRNLAPNLVGNYLFELAQLFNLFYQKHSVLKAENDDIKQFRLFLTKSVAQVIQNGLHLLGIRTVETM